VTDGSARPEPRAGGPLADVEAALDDLLERVASPRALALRQSDRAALAKAVDRVRKQLAGAVEPTLTVALAGGTGVGKSTLINALAGSVIAESSEARPTTTRIRVYHHADLPQGGLPRELGEEALFVAHERDELRQKVLVDTPDLDSFVIGHRALTQRLLEAAGLVLYVFSPEKYLEERTWSVLREEHHFSTCVAVLNKADRVPRHEIEKLTDDLRARFQDIGIPDVRILRVAARRHVESGPDARVGPDAREAPDAGGAQEARGAAHIDELPELRKFLERELREGEVAKLVYGQRRRALAHLAACIEAAAPSDLEDRLGEVEETSRGVAETASAEIAIEMADRLRAVEAELAPLAAIRQHERFRGPLRTWLAIADFFRYGLTGLVQRLLGGAPRGDAGAVRRILARGAEARFEDRLRASSRDLQQELFDRGLPVRAWREAAGRSAGPELATELAAEIESRFDVRALVESRRAGAVAWVASALGFLGPAGLLGYALYRIGEDLLQGKYTGLTVLGHFAGVLVVFFLVLQAIVSALLPSTRGVGRGVGAHAVRDVVARRIAAWIGTYREAVLDDVAALREPLASIEALFEPDGSIAARRSEVAAQPSSALTRRTGGSPERPGSRPAARARRRPPRDADRPHETDPPREVDPSSAVDASCSGDPSGEGDPSREGDPTSRGKRDDPTLAARLRRAASRPREE